MVNKSNVNAKNSLLCIDETNSLHQSSTNRMRILEILCSIDMKLIPYSKFDHHMRMQASHERCYDELLMRFACEKYQV